MSWRGFRSNLRPILSLAIGCVLFTASAVAAVAHSLLGLPWALGFLLGAIVSPPDSVAPASLRRQLQAAAPPADRFWRAKASPTTPRRWSPSRWRCARWRRGSFPRRRRRCASWHYRGGRNRLRGRAGLGRVAAAQCGERSPSAEILIALATPFLAFWPPHELGGSGVVACVAVGLYVSWNGRDYIRPATRLQGLFHLGPCELVRRGAYVPNLRLANARRRRPSGRRGLAGAGGSGAGGEPHRDRGAVFLGVSRHLFAALALAAAAQARTHAELAPAFSRRLHRVARRGEPRRRALDPVDPRRRAVSPIATSSCSPRSA